MLTIIGSSMDLSTYVFFVSTRISRLPNKIILTQYFVCSTRCAVIVRSIYWQRKRISKFSKRVDFEMRMKKKKKKKVKTFLSRFCILIGFFFIFQTYFREIFAWVTLE